MKVGTTLCFSLALLLGACVRMSPQTSARSGNPAVRRLPLYHQAQAAYARGERAKAKALLEAIQRQGPWSASETRFLQRQLALCSPGLAQDCGPRALVRAAAVLGRRLELGQVARAAGLRPGGTSLLGLKRAAEASGLRATGIQVNRKALQSCAAPAVAWWGGDHFVAVLALQESAATVHDPLDGQSRRVPMTELLARSGGYLLFLAPK